MNPQNPIGITKIIGQLNKTLSFANQVIPLYMKAKPMISNAKSAFNVVKSFMEESKKTSNSKTKVDNTSPTKEEKIFRGSQYSNNKPTFFI